MVDTRCKICFGLGWVCGNHPNRAWSDELGCKCGPAKACKCQGDVDETAQPVIVEIISSKTKH
jgi:hypothetical protein